ncbi:MAG: hypothetical protein Q9186_005872, partial [Xanthomendoza sp. 1 TL-2023]
MTPPLTPDLVDFGPDNLKRSASGPFSPQVDSAQNTISRHGSRRVSAGRHPVASHDDNEVWELKAAFDFWPPVFDHAEFCYRRRKGEPTIKLVILAGPDGQRPEQETLAELRMHDYNSKYIYWTLFIDGRRWVVHLEGTATAFGPHWCRWMGVRQRLEDKAIAFPWVVSFPPLIYCHGTLTSATKPNNSIDAAAQPTSQDNHDLDVNAELCRNQTVAEDSTTTHNPNILPPNIPNSPYDTSALAVDAWTIFKAQVSRQHARDTMVPGEGFHGDEQSLYRPHERLKRRANDRNLPSPTVDTSMLMNGNGDSRAPREIHENDAQVQLDNVEAKLRLVAMKIERLEKKRVQLE